jgi:hypothetical protein
LVLSFCLFFFFFFFFFFIIIILCNWPYAQASRIVRPAVSSAC